MSRPRRENYSRKSYDPRRAFGSANYLNTVTGGGLTLPSTNLAMLIRRDPATGELLPDSIGVSAGPPQPGRGLTGNGTAYATITGLLTTDSIVADSTDQPTCTVDGRLDIANGAKIWGVTITRSGVQIGRYTCSEGAGLLILNSFFGANALPAGALSSAEIRATYYDGTGYDLNQGGLTHA